MHASRPACRAGLSRAVRAGPADGDRPARRRGPRRGRRRAPAPDACPPRLGRRARGRRGGTSAPPPRPRRSRPTCSGSTRASSACSTSGCAPRCARPGPPSSTASSSPRRARPTSSRTLTWPGWRGRGALTTSCRCSPRSRRRRRRLPVRPSARCVVDGKRHIAVGSLFLAPGLPAGPRVGARPRGRGRRRVGPAGRRAGAGQGDPGPLRGRRGRPGADPRLRPSDVAVAARRSRSASTSNRASGQVSPSASRCSPSSWPTAQFRYHLRPLGTTNHGAYEDEQRSSTTSYASR